MPKDQFGFAPMLVIVVALMVMGIGVGVYTLGSQLSYKSRASTEASSSAIVSASLDEIEATYEAKLALKRNLDRANMSPKSASSEAREKEASIAAELKRLTLPDKATASAKPFPTEKPKPTETPAKSEEKKETNSTGSSNYTNDKYKFSLTVPSGMEIRSGYKEDSSKIFGIEIQTIGYEGPKWTEPDYYKVALTYFKYDPYTNEDFLDIYTQAPVAGTVGKTTSTETINGVPALIITYDYTKSKHPEYGYDKYYYFYRGNTALYFLGVGHKTELIDKIAKSLKFF